jgi:hypothetical protein
VIIVKEESLQFQLILFIIKKFNIVLVMYYKFNLDRAQIKKTLANVIASLYK